MYNPTHFPLILCAISFIVLWLSARIGWSFRRRQLALDEELREDFGFILAATLTLLGLIIRANCGYVARFDSLRFKRTEEE